VSIFCGALIWIQLIAAVAIHRHPSLITLAPSGSRRSAQIPQLDTPHASKESHNSIHNPESCFCFPSAAPVERRSFDVVEDSVAQDLSWLRLCTWSAMLWN